MSSNRWSRLRAKIPGLLHGPPAGRAGGDAAEVHPAGAVLYEHQHVQALAQHGVHVQEVDGKDPRGLGMQELPPGRSRAARRRVQASVVQDLPDGGRRHGDAELHQLALDPATTPQRILPGQAQHRCLIPGAVGGRPGLRHPLVSYFLAASLRCQARSVAGVTGNTSTQRRRDTIRASAENQTRSAARTAPGWRAFAARHCHAGAQALRPLPPGHREPARRSGRVSGRSAGRRS